MRHLVGVDKVVEQGVVRVALGAGLLAVADQVGHAELLAAQVQVVEPVRKVEPDAVGVVAGDHGEVAELAAQLLQVALVEHRVAHFVPELPGHINVVLPGHVRVLVEAAAQQLGGVHLVVRIAVGHHQSQLALVGGRPVGGALAETKAGVAGGHGRGGPYRLAIERPRGLALGGAGWVV